MLQTAIRCAVVFCTLAISYLPSSTEARRRGYYQYYQRFQQNAVNDVNREAGFSTPIINSSRGIGFSPTVDQLIRGCGQEAMELKNWPFGYLSQVIGEDENQRNKLQQMQNTATSEADVLGSKCGRNPR